MSKLLKVLFPVFAIVTITIGGPLLIAPGRFLGMVGWASVDPILDRVLGAALLAMAWGSLRAWRSSQPAQGTIMVELQAIFCTLAALGLARHLFSPYYYPPKVWLVFFVLLLFAILWVVAWFLDRRQGK